ncbi:MAG TPA: chromosome condensation regulator RCC1, partial [Polyangiaceae bacterium]|nr:chromosome condensation regulator RCC1 [Polyangiaceae bacterium]
GTTTDRLTPVAVTGLTGVAQIAVGYHHTCARLTDGTVKCWGNGGLGDGTTTQRLTPVAVTGLTGAVEIATRSAHTCALLTGGTVKCWGGNVYGQLGDGTTTTPRLTPVAATGLTGVAEISAGQGHTCARLTDGTVKCWGHNELGQLGYGATTYVQMTPVAVTGLTGAAEISAGYYYHTCARLTDRTVKCWGTNSTGQLGDGTTTQRTTPTVVVW